MNFLNPLFLFGLLAAALPILIHLFTRRRPRETPFPSLEFLSEVNQSEIRRLRLKQWLLLILRTLAVAAIALAMARPALKGNAGPRSGAATSVVALVDRSGSMGARAANGTLSGVARRVVEDLLSTLGPEDELLLVPYDDAPHPVTERPSSDLGRLRAATQALDAGARATDHRRALEFAGRALAEAHALNRELFWISDFQESGFDGGLTSPGGPAVARDEREPGMAERGADQGAERRMRGASVPPGRPGSSAPTFTAPEGPWRDARVYLVPLATPGAANAALTDASLAPTEGSVALSVSGASYGVAAGDLAVEVRSVADQSELGRGFLSLPERGEASTLLPLASNPEPGGIATIPDDALPLDNRRTFAAGRAGTLTILLREDGSPSPLRLALEAGAPSSGLDVRTVDAAGLESRIDEASVVVLNDVERLGTAELQALLDYYRGGGAVLLALGRRADPGFWNASVLSELGAGTLGALDESPAGAAWRLQRVIAGHAVLAGFPARPGEPLSTARFQSVRAFTPGRAARVLLAFDRAHPALLECPHALIFAAPLDPAASDFPVSGAFLPLVHQAVRVLGRGTAATSLAPGQSFSTPAATGSWRIEDEQGREVPSTLVAAAGATRLTTAPLERPGLYRVLESGKLRSAFAVNPDPRESDLTPVSEATLVRAFPSGRAQVVHAGADLARRVREARYGLELWSWFVTLALALLVAETVIGRWGMTGRASETRSERSA